MADKKSTRQGYGDGLVALGRQHDNVVVLDADLAHATGASTFSDVFPDRFYNAGIAEQDLMGLASGMSRTGLVPFASSFAVFAAGRGFELIRNGICYSKANVKIAGSHAGITAAGDGGTHQCIEDLALMRVLPGMTVFVPCDYEQAKKAVACAYAIQGPVYIRLSREAVPAITGPEDEMVPGKAQVLREGKDICLVTNGYPTYMVMEAAEKLAEEGVQATVLNLHTLKPLDTDVLVHYAQSCGRMLTVEDHSVIGGVHEAVSGALLGKVSVAYDHIGVEDRFGQSGSLSAVLEEYGLTQEHILQSARGLMKR